MDFEKLQSETIEECKKLIKRTEGNKGIETLAEEIIKISSQVSKIMLVKYHEQLNNPK